MAERDFPRHPQASLGVALKVVLVPSAEAAAALEPEDLEVSQANHPHHMKRFTTEPRANYEQRVAALGFDFQHLDDITYWDEASYYEFTERQIEQLESVAESLHQMSLQVVERVISDDLFHKLHIPIEVVPLIIRSWEKRDAYLKGRFDFIFDGSGDPKLLEYNADTPTTYFETAIIQWQWLQDKFPDKDQFNSLHEKLQQRWKEILPQGAHLHVSSAYEDIEDYVNAEYMVDLVKQIGYGASWEAIERIKWSTGEICFKDFPGRKIDYLYKIYPWEWLIESQYAPYISESETRFIEPIWKMLLSNKALLPLLWEQFPDHPNLLPAYFDCKTLGNTYVQKPLLSREGGNITIVQNGQEIAKSSGVYGSEGYIYQSYAQMPDFDGNHPLLGIWIVGDEAAGMCIRETQGLITDRGSKFIPHFFECSTLL